MQAVTNSRKLAATPSPDLQRIRAQGPGRTSLLQSGELDQLLLNSSGLLELRPPVKPAASGDDFYRTIPSQILSWYPRLVLLPNFLDEARCKHVVELAKSRMRPSDLAYRPGESHPSSQDTRTSTGGRAAELIVTCVLITTYLVTN